jgi:hypothetical protein
MLRGFGNEYADFSGDLRDVQDWNAGNLASIEFCLDVAALAIDPVSQLLAVGKFECPKHASALLMRGSECQGL